MVVESLARVGLPASIIKKYGVTKRGWREYRKKHPKTNKRRSPTTRKVKRVARRVRRHYRRYRARRRRRKKTIAMLPIVGIIGGVQEPIRRAIQGDWQGAVTELIQTSTGISTVDGTWHPEWLTTFWAPVIAGALGHKVASLMGINKTFANLPSPLNKLRL